MTEFKSGDRVEYGLQGSVLQHHGKRGTVSHIARKGGWIMVDFDCGDEQIQCAETSLVSLTEAQHLDHKALLHWVICNLLNESQLSVVPPGYTQALRHIPKLDGAA